MAKLALAAEEAKQAKLKVLRNFYKYSGPQLVPFASNVAINLDPTKFLNLPFTPEEVQALADDLKIKLAATITGGPASFAAKDKSFDSLTGALNADADIVQITVQGDLEMLLNTGYLPASNNHTSSPLDDTAILKLLNNGTTQLFLQLATVVNAKSYQVQTSADGGKTWQDGGVSTKANRIVIPNLAPGTSYLVRARAIGGSTGASNWITSGSIICT